MKQRVTINDVAKAAEVSAGTVSRVLNQRSGYSKISEETQKLVLEAAHRLGYQRNLVASALRTQRTGVVGAVVRDINDPFLLLLTQELQIEAQKHGIELFLSFAEYDPDKARRQLNVMSNWFDGLLLVGDMVNRSAAISCVNTQEMLFSSWEDCVKNSKPLVRINDAQGVMLGMDYLYTLGHRRIAFIGDTEFTGIRERLATFLRYVEQKSLFWIDSYLQPCRFSRKDAYQATQKILNLPTPPTAIFCMSDNIALGSQNGARQLGWRVPEAISIIGFDDIGASTAYPALTSIRQPVNDMAKEAFRLLMSCINNEPFDDIQLPVMIEPMLLIRNSCSPPINNELRGVDAYI